MSEFETTTEYGEVREMRVFVAAVEVDPVEVTPMIQAPTDHREYVAGEVTVRGIMPSGERVSWVLRDPAGRIPVVGTCVTVKARSWTTTQKVPYVNCGWEIQ